MPHIPYRRRRLFNWSSAISLLLMLATIGLWIATYEPPFSFVERVEQGKRRAFNYFGFEGSEDGLDRIPLWPPTVLFAILPALWIRDRQLRGRLILAGQCPDCTYDNGGNVQDKCPKCYVASS